MASGRAPGAWQWDRTAVWDPLRMHSASHLEISSLSPRSLQSNSDLLINTSRFQFFSSLFSGSKVVITCYLRGICQPPPHLQLQTSTLIKGQLGQKIRHMCPALSEAAAARG